MRVCEFGENMSDKFITTLFKSRKCLMNVENTLTKEKVNNLQAEFF